MRYCYPAIFEMEDDGKYAVEFPDLEGCYTSGDNLADAIYMAQDVLAFTLYNYEKEKREIPKPSQHNKLKITKGAFINEIACDTFEYQKRNNNKAVKKTLSIPEYLNELAMEAGLNFSQILQDALKEKLGCY
ncbi:MAG: type II toxin-antitoxin system HicB family antitoxin [Lachnospiraceae bacterium]|nr:type II toxin-antitoxin system HicB family antitoxin [Lachnospiraceae bacterium]